MSARFRLWGLSLALVSVLSACRSEPTSEPQPAKSVSVTAVASRTLEERIEATGELRAKNHAEVAAQVGGEITELVHDEGDAVAAGAVVMKIDPERRHLDLAQAQAGVAEARAGLQDRERELKRIRELSSRNITAQSELERAETAVSAARSRLDAATAALGIAERALRDANVTARFDGLIARRLVSVGEFVQPGQKLFELVSLNPIEVEFHLPEVDSSRVAVGQTLRVTVAPLPEAVFDATVTIVAPIIDARSRTLRVKGLVANADGQLRPGLFARADLGVARREGVRMVPEEAVLQRADGAVAFRVHDGNRAERRVVKTGLIRKGWVEIIEGLEVGDTVVTRGHSNLIDGSAVVVHTRAARGPQPANQPAAANP